MDHIDPIYVDLGRRIRMLRKQADASQDELARDVGLTRTSITNIERGRQQIQVHTLIAIARALDVQMNELIPFDNGRSDSQDSLSAQERELVDRLLAPSAGR